jgi:hypothetical protein
MTLTNVSALLTCLSLEEPSLLTCFLSGICSVKTENAHFVNTTKEGICTYFTSNISRVRLDSNNKQTINTKNAELITHSNTLVKHIRLIQTYNMLSAVNSLISRGIEPVRSKEFRLLLSPCPVNNPVNCYTFVAHLNIEVWRRNVVYFEQTKD